jgi:hypothetical protein
MYFFCIESESTIISEVWPLIIVEIEKICHMTVTLTPSIGL